MGNKNQEKSARGDTYGKVTLRVQEFQNVHPREKIVKIATENRQIFTTLR